jgi:hypothetical protein
MLTSHSHLPTLLSEGSPENKLNLPWSSCDTDLPVSTAHLTVKSTPSTPLRTLFNSITAMTLKDLGSTRCFFDLVTSSSVHSRAVPSKQQVMRISLLTSDRSSAHIAKGLHWIMETG